MLGSSTPLRLACGRTLRAFARPLVAALLLGSALSSIHPPVVVLADQNAQPAAEAPARQTDLTPSPTTAPSLTATATLEPATPSPTATATLEPTLPPATATLEPATPSATATATLEPATPSPTATATLEPTLPPATATATLEPTLPPATATTTLEPATPSPTATATLEPTTPPVTATATLEPTTPPVTATATLEPTTPPATATATLEPATPSATASPTPSATAPPNNAEVGPSFSLRVNFQNAAAVVPEGYVRDFGQPYGPRSSAAQGSGLTYGWVEPGSSTPLDLSVGGSVPGNGRERNVMADQRLDTLMHMQAQAPFNGTARSGSWELALPTGLYTVTVSVGDPTPDGRTSEIPRHVIRIEGTTVITNAIPSGATGAATRFFSGTATVPVRDGRLTIDAIGGHNTKINYLTIDGISDSQPPAAPRELLASAGNRRVALSWLPNNEPDLAGYQVYRATQQPVPLNGTPASGSAPLTSSSFVDTGLLNGTTYYYAVVALDRAGNRSTPATATATPQLPPPIQINFQSSSAVVPQGYLRDYGLPYGQRSLEQQGPYASTMLTYGWVDPANNRVPLNLAGGSGVSGNGRERNLTADQRLDTLMHMQADDVLAAEGRFNGTPIAGDWEIALPNGTYNVTVAVGDDLNSNTPERHSINVEGVNLISAFVPQGSAGSETRHLTRMVTVQLHDDKLTIDAQGGSNTKINYLIISSDSGGQLPHPRVTAVRPANGASGVGVNQGVATDLELPNGGVAFETLNSSNVRLIKVSTNAQIPATIGTSGGFDVITLQPSHALEPSTTYRFEISDGVRDQAGQSFEPFSSQFTTSASTGPISSTVEFEQVLLPSVPVEHYTSLVIGPDTRLYAGTNQGKIVRFPILSDGTLGTPTTITALQNYTGQPINRLLIGMVFDPQSSATNPVLWVVHSHGATGDATGYADDWSGAISRMSGSDLATVQDYVVGLPRSAKDHASNSAAFGPDGALYMNQGSNTAMGAPDSSWQWRPERLLSASVLRVNLTAITSRPLNVKTEEGGSYNPFAAGAPLTIYARGVRNAYDLVWHSNGSLYVPTNGSAAGGTVPRSVLSAACATRPEGGYGGSIVTSADAPYLGPPDEPRSDGWRIAQTQHDWLFRVVANGYYGHPNPRRCEWVMNGGNPTAGSSNDGPAEVPYYPAGTQPDPNYRGWAYDFGFNKSPNGVIEYRSTVFGGALTGKLLVVRFSNNDDILVLTPNNLDGSGNGDIEQVQEQLPGLSGLRDPLDLVEDRRNGNIYISEYDWIGSSPRLTLLRPQLGSGRPTIEIGSERLVLNGPVGSSTAAQALTIHNGGTAPLDISGITLSGADASQFQLTGAQAGQLAPGAVRTINVALAPTSAGVKAATLQIASNAPNAALTFVALRGLAATAGSEPSLQWVLDTFGIPLQVGDPDPRDSALPATPLLGDEVSSPRFIKSSSGAVTIEPLASFSPTGASPLLGFGWYPEGQPLGATELFSITTSPASNSQRLSPPVSGVTSFDPGSAGFGLYGRWPSLNNRRIYSEDERNSFSGAVPHHVRIYPLVDSAGAVVPHAYVVAFETETSAFDYQDLVLIIRNVQPAAQFAPAVALSASELVLSAQRGSSSMTATLQISNTGTAPLLLTAAQLTGATPGAFALVGLPTLPHAIPVAQAAQVGLVFRPTLSQVGILSATLRLTTNAANQPNPSVPLYGLSANGGLGDGEPPLQAIANALGYAINVGGSGLLLGTGSAPLGDEVARPLFRQAASGPATLRPVARYSGDGTLPFGFYTLNGANPAFTAAGTIASGQSQTLNPLLAPGSTLRFDAGSAAFGVFADRPGLGPRVMTQDGLNSVLPHAVRVYPLKDRSGQALPNRYLLAVEDASNGDYQDVVFVLENAVPLAGAADTTPPTVQVQISGNSSAPGVYTSPANLSITASDSGGAGLSLLAYQLGAGSFVAYTGTLELRATGSYTLTARALDGAGNLTSSTQHFSIVGSASRAEITLQNMDGVPFPDHLSFNRIQSPNGSIPNGVHDTAVLRISNTGSDPLRISALTIDQPTVWTLPNPVSLPATISPGGFLDLPVKFVAQSIGSQGGLFRGLLTIRSDDADEPQLPVTLAGFWQSVSEGNQEPNVAEIAKVFGYTTAITYSGQLINNRGRIETIGDELISPYWRRANESQPVTVRQLAAYHTQGNTATFFWNIKNSGTTTSVVVHAGVDGQSILPRRNGNLSQPASGSFSPPAGALFGFKIDPEWSNPTWNNTTPDDCSRGAGSCGHHLRVWPVRDRQGAVIPNTYLVSMDYAGINYDFNDNVYLVANIRPEDATLDLSASAPAPGAPELTLEFDRAYAGTLTDRDGQTIGFSTTQRNRYDLVTATSSYSRTLLNIVTGGAGTLIITSTAGLSSGSNSGSANNSQVNAVQLPFNASQQSFTLVTRLLGPLNSLNDDQQQAAVFFGPDQDNFIKLAVGRFSSSTGNPAIQFSVEQNGVSSTVGTVVTLSNAASIATLDLLLIGTPQTGLVRAGYRIDGGPTTLLPGSVTLSSPQLAKFFAPSARAGLLTSHIYAAVPVVARFDRFAVVAGVP